MVTAGSAARPPHKQHKLQGAAVEAAAAPEVPAGDSQLEQGEGLGEAAMAEGLGEAPASPSRDVHLGSTGGNNDSEGSVSQPPPFSGQPSQLASPLQQGHAAMLPPAPHRQAQQAAPRRPLQLAELQPGDEAIEVGGRWAQKAVRGDFDGLRRREHLKAPIHLATPVVALLPPAASAAPVGPAARGWAGRADAPAAAAAAGTAAVVGSAAWPYARPPAAHQAWQGEERQWQLPPQWQRQQRLGGIAQDPGQPREEEEVEQVGEEAGAAGYISEHGMEEGDGWPPPAAQLAHAPPHRRVAAPHAVAGGRKRHRQAQHQVHHAGGRLAVALAQPQAAKRPRVRQGGGGQPAWPREVERRGHADLPQEPWSEQEAEEFEVDHSGYSRWAGWARMDRDGWLAAGNGTLPAAHALRPRRVLGPMLMGGGAVGRSIT